MSAIFPGADQLPTIDEDEGLAVEERRRYLDLLLAYDSLVETLAIREDAEARHLEMHKHMKEEKDQQIEAQRRAIEEYKGRVEYLKEVLRIIVNEV